MSAAEFRAAREGVDYCGGKVDLPQMTVEDGIAMIPITGPIGRGLDKFEKGAGAVDVEDVREDLDRADEDDEVHSALLLFDSPGGMYSGTPELADRIASFSKPIYSYSPGQICSAAYWLACTTAGIFATKSADIGCIGVYCPFYDLSEMARQQGVKVQVFSSGKYKGMGVPGTSLTKDQAALMQQRIMDMADSFYEHVREMRGEDIADETMQGQTFQGESAVEAGLLDQVVDGLEEVLEYIRQTDPQVD